MSRFYQFLLSLCLSVSAQQALAQGYQLVWSDEFNYNGLPDPAKWGYDAWEPLAVNNELQKYTTGRLENTRVEDGVLKIEARRDFYQGKYEYTSGRITTQNKFAFTKGIVEVRAKLVYGRGTWPGIFMLSNVDNYGEWPKSGEIDIMEHVGHNMDWVRSSIHCEEYNFKKFHYEHLGEEKNADVYVRGVAEAFHTYKIEWTDTYISASVDNNPPHFFYKNENRGPISWPFDKDFYLILNQAVGGGWGGDKGIDQSVFPQVMMVDYVRVFQWKDAGGPVAVGNNPPAQGRTIRIEAENYKQASGIKVEASSEGGLNVGYIDAVDWMIYSVNVPKASWYEVQYRVASREAGGKIVLDQNGKALGSVEVPVTWDWQNWQTVSHRVYLQAGEQNLAIYAEKGGFNVNWMQLIETN
ncbi:MAG: carbohydrate-binding protein [Oligoflexus sp.]|nr:carbohydrate-binding protein [Oligoflexus sp.]